METIDFGCQVRCLNRQRLIPGSTHPQLNQCASQFLAKVRKEVMTSDSPANTSKLPEVGWMKLKLSERGLRILPPTSSISSSSSCASSTTSSTSGMRNLSLQQKSRKSDEGFESDSDTSIQPHNNSGGSSSGVNSSSSDIDEADEVIRNNSKKSVSGGDSSDSDCSAERMNVLLTVPIRCALSDILSCQHPPALGRHVILLTLRSADDSALDILALECSAEEPARILTMLCQKIQASGTGGGGGGPVNAGANNPAPSAAPSTCAVSTGDPGPAGKKSGPQASAVGSHGPVAAKTAAVSIQSWSDRDRDKRTLDAILVDSKHSSASDIGVGVKAQNIIRKLERQHSEWSLIQRRTHDGLTHLQISKQKSSSTFLNHTAVAGGVDVGQSNASLQTATSGGMLNSSSSSSKKGMPYGGQLARLETALAITNSHQGQASRSSGVGGVAAGLKRSETTTAMHQKLSKSKSSGSSVASGSSPSPSSCILSLQTPELPMGPSVTGLSPAEVTDASTSTSQSPTPPLPQSHPPTKTSRWSFGAPFRQQPQPQRLHSPEASRRNTKSNQRGRSSERKASKFDALSTSSAPQTNKSSELNGLFVSSSGMLSIKSNNNNNNKNNNNSSKKNWKSSKSLPEILPVQSPVVAPKIKRDPSKTRSFLMKLTSSSSRKSPTPPTPPPPSSTLSLNSDQRSGVDPESHRSQHPLKLQSRGRSLIRLRSSTRLQSPPPPGHSGGQTFLIPTKSGQELTRNIYPKEGPVTQSSSQQQQQQQQPVFHLLTGHNNKNASGRLRYSNGPPPVAAMSNGWAGYCWNEAAAAAAAALVRHPVPQYATSMDANNNQHLHQQQQQQQQQQQWIYFHPHPVHHPAPPPQPPPTLIKAGDFNKLRLQRSRSQSPGRMRSSQRWLPPPPPPPAGPPSIGHYYALPSPIHQQPVSLPPDMSHMLSQQQRSSAQTSPSTSNSSNQDLLSAAARSFRRSKSTHTRMSSRSHLAPSKSSSQNNNNSKAVTFHAFATVQLVD